MSVELTPSTPVPAGQARAGHTEIDCEAIARAVVWMPAEHRQATLDEATALRILRCTPGSLAILRDLGLPAEQGADGRRYDPNDIRNAALYSGSGRTEVEVAMRSILSFLNGSDDAMFAERRWAYEMVASTGDAPAGGGVDGAGGGTADGAGPAPVTCALHPVTPAVFGGEAGPLVTGDGEPVVRDGDRILVPAGVAVRGTMVTRGRQHGLRDPAIGAITAEFLAAGPRWHHLSAGLKEDPKAAFALGIGNCDTLSTQLLELLTGAGFQARVYRGWIVGITEVPHSWVEVVDDGQVKVIDPSLMLLATQTTLGTAGFPERALGSALNRIVPTRCEVGEPLGEVVPQAGRCEVRFRCRAAGRATAPRRAA